MANREALLVYAYAGCGACRKALAWLGKHGFSPRVVPIVEQPPSAKELSRLMRLAGLPGKRWLNTSGQSYRALTAARGKDAIAALSDAEIAKLCAADGKLIRRPVLVRGDTVLVGFDEAAYAKL